MKIEVKCNCYNDIKCWNCRGSGIFTCTKDEFISAYIDGSFSPDGSGIENQLKRMKDCIVSLAKDVFGPLSLVYMAQIVGSDE